MRNHAPFRLNRSGILLAVISAAFAGEAGAAAGRAEFVVGGVTVAGRDGVERPLTRGAEVDNGDTVRTKDGRAQIRFTDGAYTSLQPNTEFGIRDYRYENRTDGSERGFFGLLKGAMRTVTGAIGRINRDRYTIATPTATVGIRGTGGVIQVQDDGSTLVIGTSGIWSLTNTAGSVDVPAGTSALAPSDPNQPPQETTDAPTSGPAPVQDEQPEFVAGQERDATGAIVIPQPSVLVSGSGFHLVSAFNTGIFEGIVLSSDSANAVFDGAGQMTASTGPTFRSTLLSGGSHADFGTDGILAWGRWIGPVENCSPSFCSNDSYTANEGFHYVIGMPTPVLPTSGGGTYTLVGATRPTYQFDQSVAPGTFTGTLGVAFGAVASVTANFNIAMPDGRNFGLVGSNTSVTTADWSITPAVSASAGACSVCGCTAFIQGFFAGPNAERAGVGYHINNTATFGTEVIGAAAFQKP